MEIKDILFVLLMLLGAISIPVGLGAIIGLVYVRMGMPGRERAKKEHDKVRPEVKGFFNRLIEDCEKIKRINQRVDGRKFSNYDKELIERRIDYYNGKRKVAEEEYLWNVDLYFNASCSRYDNITVIRARTECKHLNTKKLISSIENDVIGLRAKLSYHYNGVGLLVESPETIRANLDRFMDDHRKFCSDLNLPSGFYDEKHQRYMACYENNEQKNATVKPKIKPKHYESSNMGGLKNNVWLGGGRR